MIGALGHLPDMPDPEQDISQDPDVVHLFDLLRMLPSPADPNNADFWAVFQRRHGDPGKIGVIAVAIHDPTPTTISYACRYVLVFFSGNDSDLWTHLDVVSQMTFDLDGIDHTGRFWAEDVCRTAWTLYVRYTGHGGANWREGWQPI